MRRRETIKGTPSADLLVCFPHRAHLTLMPPKATCSPASPLEPNQVHRLINPPPQPHHRRTKSNGEMAQSSPVLWGKDKERGLVTSEATSPKVTCAGQIKVKAKNNPCKSWQSVMHEIERNHKNDKHKKKPTWGASLGLSKDVMQFLSCLRSLKFNFRCFGSFTNQSEITSEDDEEDERDHVGSGGADYDESSKTFSKWFMVPPGGNNNHKEIDMSSSDDSFAAPAAAPPNALLLMRCRSAPVKSWLVGNEHKHEEKMIEENKRNLKRLVDEEKRVEEEEKKKQDSFVMSYDTDSCNISTDIVRETWVSGGLRDALSKSRSGKR